MQVSSESPSGGHARSDRWPFGVTFPSICLRVTQDEIILEVDSQGFDPDEVEIEAGPDLITISGSLPSTGNGLKGPAGVFTRMIPLPRPIQPQAVSVSHQRDRLIVRAPLR